MLLLIYFCILFISITCLSCSVTTVFTIATSRLIVFVFEYFILCYFIVSLFFYFMYIGIKLWSCSAPKTNVLFFIYKLRHCFTVLCNCNGQMNYVNILDLGQSWHHWNRAVVHKMMSLAFVKNSPSFLTWFSSNIRYWNLQ